MAIYPVSTVVQEVPDDFAGLTRTWFTTNGQTAYALHKPENPIRVGDSLDGTIAVDKRGNNKFTRTKQFPSPTPTAVPVTMAPPGPVPVPTHTATPAPRRYEADPAKMKQEYNLDVAKNMSIQRQVAMKGVVDLVVAGKRDYDTLIDTYCDLMEILTTVDWRELEQMQPLEQAVVAGSDLQPPLLSESETKAKLDEIFGAPDEQTSDPF